MRGRDPAPPTPGVGRPGRVGARGTRVWPCLEFVLSAEEAGSAQTLGDGGEELGLRKGLSSRSTPKDLEPEGAAGEGHLHQGPPGLHAAALALPPVCPDRPSLPTADVLHALTRISPSGDPLGARPPGLLYPPADPTGPR